MSHQVSHAGQMVTMSGIYNPRFSNWGRPLNLHWLISEKRNWEMLNLSLIFLVIAITAGIFGFSGISVAAAGIAKIVFYIFITIFAVMLIAGLVRKIETRH